MSRFEDEEFKQLQLKVKFNIIPKTRLKRFEEHFKGYRGLVRSEPGNIVLNPLFGQNVEKIYRIEPRKDDIWLLTYPKCGNEIASNKY